MNVDENTAEFATTLRDFCLCLPFEERLVFIDIVERVRSAACTAPIGALRLIIADALRGLGRQLEEDEKMTNDNQQSRAALAPEKKQQIRDAKGRVCPFCGGPMYYHPPTDVFACTMANCPMKSSYPIKSRG